MTTPTIVTQALADDPAALKTLQAAITQSAQLAISGALQRWGAPRHLSHGPTAAELERVVNDKLFEEQGKLLKDWAENASIFTFTDYIARIAEHITLVHLAVRGHEKAGRHLWNAFYNAAKNPIGVALGKCVVHRYLDANELQKDLLGSAYEKMWEKNQLLFLGWSPVVGSFNAYVATVAANHTYDVCRKRQEQLTDGDDLLFDQASEAENPEDWLLGKDQYLQMLQQLRASLTTPDERNMFYLIVELGLPIKEIVKRTGKSPNAVSQRRKEFAELAKAIRKKLDSDPDPSSRNTSGKKK